MLRINAQLAVSDFERYDNATVMVVALTERQRAILLAFSDVMQSQALWYPISDQDWDVWSAELAECYAQIT